MLNVALTPIAPLLINTASQQGIVKHRVAHRIQIVRKLTSVLATYVNYALWIVIAKDLIYIAIVEFVKRNNVFHLIQVFAQRQIIAITFFVHPAL